MIEKLPFEVFEILYSLLSWSDLIECQCVSQAWYQQWVPFAYQRLYTVGERQLQELLKTSVPYSYRGQQVRKLVIEKGHVQPETLGKLPQLFPFLETFMFDGVVLCDAARKKTLLFHHYQQRKQNEEVLKIKNNFKPWSQSIRQLVEYNGITFTHCILTENYCPQLTRLVLQFNNTNDSTNSKNTLFLAFKNSPNLIHLSLEKVFLQLHELESIHTSCKKLEILNLKNAVFLAPSNKTDIPDPAADIHTLECIDCDFYDAYFWLEYIGTKYCYAETLEIGFIDGCITTDILAFNCRRLKNLKLLPLSKDFLHILDQQGTCLRQVTLQQDIKLLTNSRQKISINELVIYHSSLHFILPTVNQCPFLTHLVLHIEGKQKSGLNQGFSLYQLILHCPHLFHLTLTDAELTLVQEEEAAALCALDQPVSKLNTLVMENCILDQHVFINISNLCLQLKTLSLYACHFSQAIQGKIYLPHHSLDLIVIDSVRVSRHCSVRLGTLRFLIAVAGKSVCYDLMAFHFKRYWFDQGQERLHASKVKRINQFDPITGPYLSVVCKSIKQLQLTGLDVIKNNYLLF